MSKYRWTKHFLVTLLANHTIYYPSPMNLTYAWSFGSAAGIYLAIPFLCGIFLAMHYIPHIDLAFGGVATKFFSCLTCDAPEWKFELGKSNTANLDVVLEILFILVFGGIIFLLALIRDVYYTEKRRTFLAVILDIYIWLSLAALNRKLPRRFILLTAGFGSLVVRLLFAHNYISIKLALVLAFIVPGLSLVFFLGVLLLPLYLAGVYPKTFGKTFFGFLRRYASKEVFELLIYKGVVVDGSSAKNMPSVQKRTFHSSAKSEDTFLQHFITQLAKTNPVSNPTHLANIKTIANSIEVSFLKGEWSLMCRRFPSENARILLQQAQLDPARARILASQADSKTGPFAPFKYPEGILQLQVENIMHQTLGVIGLGTIQGPLRDCAVQAFGEVVVHDDTWFLLVLMGVTSGGMLFHGNYTQDPLFRQRTLGYLSAGRTLDGEGNLMYPPVESVISDSSLVENLPWAEKIPDMVFPEMEENLSFISDLKSSSSEISSDLVVFLSSDLPE